MIDVILYERADCHLCKLAKANLEALQEAVPHRLKAVNIDNDADLLKAYGLDVPVVEIGPYILKSPFNRQDLWAALMAAQERDEQIVAIDEAIREGRIPLDVSWTLSDRFTYWLARHYLALFNVFVFLYVGLPFLAPILMKVGATAPAGLIYRAYGAVCHQLAFRSWFLFGEQPAYPRQAAGLEGWLSYGQATGLDEVDLWTARRYEGDERVGYKVALCQRDVAIYLGILSFGLIFGLLGRRLRPLPWYIWILLGIAPIGLDGVSQLLSQLSSPYNLSLSFRESTPFLRTFTGGLFGLMTAWFGYPLVEESMGDTLEYMNAKLKRISERQDEHLGSQEGQRGGAPRVIEG